jgi:predicted NUDIX family NTP pyrophosphohydrolase
MCRLVGENLEFFLVHPGGPYFSNKDAGAWSIPKGLREGDEDLLSTGQREFMEETGIRPAAPFHELGTVKQKGGKVVHAWAFIGSWDPATGIVCNSFSLEWPPRSGRKVDFPEVDKAEWFTYEQAIRKIIQEQIPFINRAKALFESQKTKTTRPSA